MKIESVILFISLNLSLATTVHAQTGPWAKYDSKLKNDALVREADAGNLMEVKSIVAGGGNVNVQLEQTKLTPLMAAASGGKFEVVQYLLNQGADPAAKDWNGYTALDRAKWSGVVTVIQLLDETLKQKTTPPPVTNEPIIKKEQPLPGTKPGTSRDKMPVITNNTSVRGSLSWPAFGAYKTGDSIRYYVPTGWRTGVITEVGTIENKDRKFIPNEKKYLIDPDAYALSNDWYAWSQVVKTEREAFWTSWFIGEWQIGEVMAHNTKIENGTQTDTYSYMDAAETLKVSKNGNYSWKQLSGKVVTGKWKAATDGPGIVLQKAYREFDWTIRNATMPEDLQIRKLELIRLYPSKNVGSISGKRKTK